MKDICVKVIIVLHFLNPFYFNIALNFRYKFKFSFYSLIICLIWVSFYFVNRFLPYTG